MPRPREAYFGKPLKDITHRRGRHAGRPAQGARRPTTRSATRPGRAPASSTSSSACRKTASSPPTQADAAKKEELHVRDRPRQHGRVHAEYVAETVRQLMYRAVRRRHLHARPECLHHAQSRPTRTAAYKALRKGIMDYERRQIYRGPEKFVDLPADPKEARRRDRRRAGRPPGQRRRDVGRGAGGQRPRRSRPCASNGDTHRDHRRRPAARRSPACPTRRRPTSRSAAAPSSA